MPVIAAFSHPGDLVAIPAATCPALITAAAGTGRRVLHTDAQPGSASYRPGQADLAVTVFSGGPPAGTARETVLYAACQRALRPGGILAVIIGQPAAGQIPDLGHAVACARAAGFVFAQHIVLIHATVQGGQLRPFHATTDPDDDSLTIRVHTDLLILTKPGGLDDR
jgi:hypothetical protein